MSFLMAAWSREQGCVTRVARLATSTLFFDSTCFAMYATEGCAAAHTRCGRRRGAGCSEAPYDEVKPAGRRPSAAATSRWSNVFDRLPTRSCAGRARPRRCLGSIPIAGGRAPAEKLHDALAEPSRARCPEAVGSARAGLGPDAARTTATRPGPGSASRTPTWSKNPTPPCGLRTDAARRFQKTANATAMIWK